jgi:hypothetical protein
MLKNELIFLPEITRGEKTQPTFHKIGGAKWDQRQIYFLLL